MTVDRHIRHARRFLRGDGLGPFLIRSLAGSAAVRMASMVASFAVGVQLARGLGVEGYGYYGLALSIVTLAGIPSEMGLPKLVTREVAAASARKDFPQLFGVLRWANTMAMRISAVLALAVVTAAILLAYSRPSPLSLALALGAPVIPFMALARVRGGALQGLHHIVRGQIPANLLRPVMLSLLLVLIPIAGLRLHPAEAMALNAITAFAAFMIAALWLKERLPATAPAEFIQTGRRWLASCVPMALTEGMRVLQSELTILLLGALSAPTAVGLFRIATVTATMASAPIFVVNRVAFPLIARLYAEKDQKRLQQTVTRLAWTQFAGVAVLSLPLLLAAEPLLRIVFGASFAPAASALEILAIGQILNAAFGPNAVLLNMTHHEQRVTRAMGVGLALNVILVPILLTYWGLPGAAMGIVASLLCWNLLAWIDGWRLIGVDTSIAPRVLVRKAA